jgi:glycosyltransferase involved in cell wall biosynthesis
MISVVIPTYNRRELLGETLASVFAQTGADFEVIVVDDGSTDGTGAYLRHQPVHAISLPHSGLPSVARNAGLAQVRLKPEGEYIAFLDSDDLWEPTALAELRAALARTPEAGFAFCDFVYFSEAGELPGQYLSAEHKRSGDVFESLLETCFIIPGSLMIRRTAIEVVGEFDPHCRMSEDWDYFLRLAARFPAVYVDKCLVRMRAHPGNRSYEPGGEVYRCNKIVSGKLLAWCRAHRLGSLDSARRIHRRSLYESARYHWHHGSRLQTALDLVRLVYV